MEGHKGGISESEARNEQGEHMINDIMRIFT